MRYENYMIRHFQDSFYYAFKESAARVNGLSFSHQFYFQYCKESYNDDYVNKKACVLLKPGMDSNYYQANVKGGVILSIDLKTFVFQPSNIDYVKWQVVSSEDFSKFEPE